MEETEGEILKNPLEELGFVEEKQTLDLEEDEDNSEDNTKKQEEKPKEPEKVKKEEPKKQEPTAKEKRHQEQEVGALAEVKRLRNLVIEREVKDASNDITSLIDLHGKDPKLAKEVAGKFDWSETSRGDYGSFLASKGVVAEKPTHISEEEIEKRVEARLAQREHESALVEAQTLLEGLPEELQEEAVEEFNDLIEGKTLTREKALKYAQLVTLSLGKGKLKVDSTAALKKLSSTGISTTKKPSTSDKVEVIVDGKLQLLDLNQIK